MLKRKGMGAGAPEPEPVRDNVEGSDDDESPLKKTKEGGMIASRACFAAGCYWGTENYIKNKFGKAHTGWIVEGKVGFMGGRGIDPSYKEGERNPQKYTHSSLYQCITTSLQPPPTLSVFWGNGTC